MRSDDSSCDDRAPRNLRRGALGPYRYVRRRWRALFALVDFLGAALFSVVRWIRGLVGNRAAIEPNDVRRILLVQLDHFGDAVISTVVLGPLRKHYPNAAIEVLAAPWNRQVFEAAAEVDFVHVAHSNRFGREGRFGWAASMLWWGLRLRRRRFDLAIDVRGEFPHAVLLWLSGAPRRLGWNSGGGGFLLTDSPRFVPNRPEVASRLALLAELGIRPTAHARRPRPVFRTDASQRERARRALAELDREDNHGPLGPRIALHIGAGTPAKQWPAEHWRELIGRLIVELDARIILVGGRRERPLVGDILGGQAPTAVADWTGRLSIGETAAVLEQVDLVVGGDSGPAHLAAAVDTPVVVLFSGTNNVRQWRPCGRRVRTLVAEVVCSPCHVRQCPRLDHPCMRRLTPDRVATAVCRYLTASRPRPTVSQTTLAAR